MRVRLVRKEHIHDEMEAVLLLLFRRVYPAPILLLQEKVASPRNFLQRHPYLGDVRRIAREVERTTVRISASCGIRIHSLELFLALDGPNA